jgi:SET family sugar efflux transporter-like MFS transporter
MSRYRLSSPTTIANYLVAFSVAANASLVAPTLSLHLSQTYGIAAFWIGIFFIGKAASSIIASQLIARWSDRLADRRPLITASMFCGGISCLLFSWAETFKTMLVIACTVFGMAYISWAQLMAQVREFADEFLPPVQATLFNSITRACMAFAWVAGPPLGFLLMAQLGFKLQCQIVATSYFVTGAAIWVLMPKITPKPKIKPIIAENVAIKSPRNWTLFGSICAFTLMFSTNASYQIALPLMITEKLHASPEFAG